MAFIQRLNEKKSQVFERETGDPWRFPLARIRGQVGHDGLEKITTQAVLDVLEVPQRARRAGTYRRLAKVMSESGWTAVRVRGCTRGGYLEQCRGFCRDGRSRQSVDHI
jgi:hypothetical protein